MSFIVVGTNHKHSPIEIREKLAFAKKKIKDALSILLNCAGVKAAVILSTCNRVELYAGVSDIETGINSLKIFLADYHQQELDKIASYLYVYIGKEAARHLFNVSCGIDSQFIGEAQILEQVRFAYEEAGQAGCADDFLGNIFSSAIETAQAVKEKTWLSKGDISIGSIVIEIIKEKLGNLKDKKILLIGTGKVMELVVSRLKSESPKAIFVSSRRFEKAKEFARQLNTQAVRFSCLKQKLEEADVIISATASPHLILRKEDLRDAKRPLLIIDLAVPRDVDPQVKYMDGVSLFCLDDLDFIIENNLRTRKESIPQALDIINRELESLCLSECLESEPEPALLL